MKRKWHSLVVFTLLAIQGIGLSATANAAPTINISDVTLAKKTFLVSEEIVVTLKVISTNGTKNVSGQITAPGGGFSGSQGQLVDGTDKDGTYKITFKLASYSESGSYRIDLYAVSNENLVASASGGNVNVTGSSVSKPSIAISAVKQKATFALVGGQFEVTLRVVSTNGTKNVSGQITAPGGGFSGSQGQLVDGTDKDGTYKITFGLASYAEIGSYRIDLYAVSVENLVGSASGGNFQVYGSLDAKAAADKAAADKAAADKAAADKAAADKAAAEAKAKAAATKKTTITCVKGKLTKKVTASKPKCPVGYMKK
jgi:5-hydroxyisourate hydrolase-like protein (transthyretin family)